MSQRVGYNTQSAELFEFNNPAKEGAIKEKVRDLVAIRASQLNGCAFSLDTSCLRNTSALSPDRCLQYVGHFDDLYERASPN